jgi:hypothetical protein
MTKKVIHLIQIKKIMASFKTYKILMIIIYKIKIKLENPFFC